MGSAKKLGIFWGDNSFTLVETDGKIPLQVIPVFFGDSVKRAGSPFSSDLSKDLQVVALLQKTLRDYKIDTSKVSLSLPSKDVILRSFAVPSVNAEELASLIEFEAKKHVPVDIKDLAFVYHAVPFNEGNVRRLRVIFYAARRNVLDKYEQICTQANLTVSVEEPAPMSLAKALVSRNLLRVDHRTAIVHMDGNIGRMMFFDKGVIQFMREFLLSVPGGEEPAAGDVVRSRLINETRNSLDYYQRQISKDKIEDILIVGPAQAEEMAPSISTELGLSVKHVLPSLNVPHFQASGVDGLCAFGACLSTLPAPLSAFNFAQKRTSALMKTAAFGISFDPKEFAPAIRVGLLCLVVVGAAFAAAQLKINELEAKVKGLSVGEFDSLSADDILKKKSEATAKLSNYKKIRFKSDTALLLVYVVQQFPPEVWLNSLNLTYADDGKLSFSINGYAYSKDQNRQLLSVDELVNKLKSDKQLSGQITDVQMTSMQRQEINSYPVTSFVITCS